MSAQNGEKSDRAAVYRFGPCELDVHARRLLVQGRTRHLERRPLDLLLCLLARRDRIVGKKELFELVWGGVSVCDGALSQCVWTARRAIGDGGRRDGWIRTVNGLGYRFAGPVEVVPVPDDDWAAEVAFTRTRLVSALLRSPHDEDHALARLLSGYSTADRRTLPGAGAPMPDGARAAIVRARAGE